MSGKSTHIFVPGDKVSFYNPSNKRTGVVVETKNGLRIQTALANGKTQLWPIKSGNLVLWTKKSESTAPIQKTVKPTKKPIEKANKVLSKTASRLELKKTDKTVSADPIRAVIANTIKRDALFSRIFAKAGRIYSFNPPTIVSAPYDLKDGAYEYIKGRFVPDTKTNPGDMDYPLIKEESVLSVNIKNTDALKNAFDFVSKDKLRPGLMCVKIDVRGKNVYVWGSDGYVAYKRILDANVYGKQTNYQILIDPSAAKSIEKIGTEAKLYFYKDGQIRITSEKIDINTKSADEAYPDIDRVIPSTARRVLRVGKKLLLDALDEISVYENPNTNQIVFFVENENLRVFAKDTDRGVSHSTSLSVDIISGESAVNNKNVTVLMPMVAEGQDGDFFSFNSRYLVKTLRVMTGEYVYIAPVSGNKNAFTFSDSNIFKPMKKNENPFFASGIRSGATYTEAKSGRSATIESVDGATAFVRFSDGKTMMAGVDKLGSMIEGGLWVKKLSNPKSKSGKPRKTNEKFLAINKRAGEIWKSGKVKQYRDAIKMAAEEMRSGKRRKNPSDPKNTAFESEGTKAISIPLEKGLAYLAQVTVVELKTSSGQKKVKTLSAHNLYASADGRWMISAPGRAARKAKSKISGDAILMHEKFNHYAFDGTMIGDFPIERGLRYDGVITAIEYESDKMIYKTDQKRGAKQRAYVHRFDDPSDIYTIKGDHRYMVIGPMSKPITERGIEA